MARMALGESACKAVRWGCDGWRSSTVEHRFCKPKVGVPAWQAENPDAARASYRAVGAAGARRIVVASRSAGIGM